MQLFLDTWSSDEVEFALENWNIDGVTFRPPDVSDRDAAVRRQLEQIAALVRGTNLPVAVPIDPRLTDSMQMVDAALEVRALSPNFIVSLIAGESACRAVRELVRREVPTNVTLAFSVAQAWHAARAGAMYVSTLLGWKDRYGDVAEELVPNIAVLLDNFGYSTQLIATAVRNAHQIGDAAVAGAHVVAASASVIRDSFQNPYTALGASQLAAHWERTD